MMHKNFVKGLAKDVQSLCSYYRWQFLLVGLPSQDERGEEVMSTIHLVSSHCSTSEDVSKKNHLKAIGCKRPTVSNGPEIMWMDAQS